VYALNAGRGTYRHKNRGVYCAMVCLKSAQPGFRFSVGIEFLEVHKGVDKNTIQRYSYLITRPIFAISY
jgi:hypothetical protein